jgi:hypothetical protein
MGFVPQAGDMDDSQMWVTSKYWRRQITNYFQEGSPVIDVRFEAVMLYPQAKSP